MGSAMLMSRPDLLRMFVKGMRRGNGQCTNRDRSSHEEENFVHRNSQSDAYTNQQRDVRAINASVIFSDCLHIFPLLERT
jgi:hypothetical protein